MDFLCDVHISIKIAKHLTNCGHYAIHTNSLPSKWHSTDSEICLIADQKNLIVITKDEDFRSSFLLRQTQKKLIRIVLGNISNKSLIGLLDKHMSLIQPLIRKKDFILNWLIL
jgi:predicted nuclease of predicted toxin-antitoxin system